jgi:hypothetical protein
LVATKGGSSCTPRHYRLPVTAIFSGSLIGSKLFVNDVW